MKRAAVFFDRDGTLCEEHGFLEHEDRLRLLPGAAAALRHVRGAGFLAVLVTNQSGLARGLFDAATLARIHERLRRLLAAEGAALDAIEHCPHHPAGRVAPLAVRCACRKPEPGLLLRARDELDLDLARSYLVGDRASDVEAGRRAGAQPVLVLTGHGRAELVRARAAERRIEARYVARDVLDAAEWIVRHARGERAA